MGRKGVLGTAVSTLAVLGLVSGCGSFGGGSQASVGASNVIKIGTLYAKSGAFATSSMPEYEGLKFWVHQVNKDGGVFVKATGKREKVQLVAYNDQSSTQTATNLYNQLITQDHVNIFVSDFGSVLTSVAIPVAKEHKMLLFDQSGTGVSFFSNNNPYIVLTSLRSSALWPDSLAKYVIQRNLTKVAIVYDSNDFDQSQEATLKSKMKSAGLTPIYDHAVSTSTSNYSVILHDIQEKHPDMVIEFGYPNNDLAFLQDLRAGSYNFSKVFTIFPGQLPALFVKNLGKKAIDGTYTYPTPPLIKEPGVTYGLSLQEFETKFQSYSKQTPNFLNVAGYNTGLIVEKTLETAKGLSQLDLRQAVNQFSGKIRTLDGNFQINPENGAQVGEALPVGKWTEVGGKLTIQVVD
ncbi:MAG: ABC transporter substrate-binding protein [Alicyclobacillaceae bacterium]|jgi:branched-chain amino acid transport system substrate-binding protein|nr:ABC transporter substrate-binding protein [Alicyclobacillaceae bacterium]